MDGTTTRPGAKAMQANEQSHLIYKSLMNEYLVKAIIVIVRRKRIMEISNAITNFNGGNLKLEITNINS